MQLSLAPRGPGTVATEVRRVVRLVIGVALLLLVANVGGRVVLLGVLAPEVQHLRDAQAQLDVLHAGMVDEETGVRGYLATGSRTFLQPYLEAQPKVEAASSRLAGLVSGSRMTRKLVLEENARLRWNEGWADQAVDPAQARVTGVGGGSRLTAFMTEGKHDFDAYRAAHSALHDDIVGRIDHAEALQKSWLVWTGAFQALLALGAVFVSAFTRRRMTSRITAPVEALAAGISRIAGGDLGHGVSIGKAPLELADLGDRITVMGAALNTQVVELEEQREQVRRHAARLSTVLGAAREVAGSLSLRYVLRSVAEAAVELGAGRVRIWLLEEDEHTLRLSFDTLAGPEGPLVPVKVVVGTGLVGRTAKYGRPVGPEPLETQGGQGLAVPLIIGGRVVGALECFVADAGLAGQDTLEVLEALAGHAAGAVASAQLHERTAELAMTDALTRLPNRRAFESHFAAEVERAQRYGRPLAVVSIDLDHFKQLNDRFGHAYGDVALQQTSSALLDAVRGTDRVYRMGGEELLVLCPETQAEDARVLAERLRVAVEATAGPDAPVVTASLGVAELPAHGSSGQELLEAADRALYAAKAQGRNRVVVAPPLVPAQVVRLGT